MRALLFALPLLAFGCPGEDKSSEESDTDTDTDTDADTDADTDVDGTADTSGGDSGNQGDSGDSGGGGGVPNCPDDMLEDNDSIGGATTGVTNTTNLESLDNDDDFFEIDVPVDGIVEVSIDFVSTQGDIDLELVDDFGAVLDGSYSVSNGEFVTFANTSGAPATWYARVYMYSTGGCNSYDIDIGVGLLGPEICDDLFDNDQDGGTDCDDYECLGASACLQACPPEDVWESNDDQAGATVGFTSDVGLMVHPQNEDWFAIEVEHDQLASATVDHDPLLGEVDVFLVGPTGTTLDSDTSASATKIAQAVNSSGNTETWYARVAASDSCNGYDLDLFAGPVPDEDCGDGLDNDIDGFFDCGDYDCLTDLACPNTCPPEDSLEDNDNQGQAVVGAVSTTGLMVHDQDEDYYELVVGPGEVGTFDILFADVDGDIDLQLLDETGAVVTGSGSTDDNESVFVTNETPDPQTYVARVFLWSGICNGYDMVVYTGPIPDETCDDQVDNDLDNLSDCADYDCIDDPACTAVCAPEDSFEDNDEEATAAPLVGNGPFTVHAQDDDWFSFDVPVGEQAIVTLDHDHTQAVLDIRLFDETGSQLDTDLSTTNDQKVVSAVNTGLNDATWTVEVVHWNGAPCNTYTLDAAVAPVPDEDCADGTDNDLDTYTDCDDYDCLGEAGCTCPEEDVFAGVNADPAVALPIPSTPDLSTHTQRPDWFRVTAGADELLTIDVSFVDADGNLAVDVYDADEQLLQTEDTFNDNEQVVIANDQPDSTDFLVRVRTSGADICNSFDWAWTAAPLPDEVCDDNQDNDFDGYSDCNDYDCGIGFVLCDCPADDAREPNDSPAEASPNVLSDAGLQVFKQDPDFFSYTVPDGFSMAVAVLHTVADGDIDFFLRNPDGDTVLQGFTGSDDEMGTWVNTTGGDIEMSLQVSIWPSDTDGFCNTYDLAVDITP